MVCTERVPHGFGHGRRSDDVALVTPDGAPYNNQPLPCPRTRGSTRYGALPPHSGTRAPPAEPDVHANAGRPRESQKHLVAASSMTVAASVRATSAECARRWWR